MPVSPAKKYLPNSEKDDVGGQLKKKLISEQSSKNLYKNFAPRQLPYFCMKQCFVFAVLFFA